MSAMHERHRLAIWSALILAIFLIAAGLALLFYGIFFHQWETPLVRRVAMILHIPAARVGGRAVLYTEYLAHVDAERKFLSGPAAQAQGIPPVFTRQMKVLALDRAMRIVAIDDLAQQADLIVTPLDRERAYAHLLDRVSTSTSVGEIQAYLQDVYGWSEADFKTHIVGPALLEDGLRQKYLRDTKDPQAFDKRLTERLHRSDVVRYLRF